MCDLVLIFLHDLFEYSNNGSYNAFVYVGMYNNKEEHSNIVGKFNFI
jgi:hypothetical protein